MRPRYSFSSRKSRRARDSKKMRKQKGKYPDILQNIIKESDIILQVLDSRFPEDTRNKEVEKQIKQLKKQIIFILNKVDLTTSSNIKKHSYLKPNVPISCIKRQGSKKLRDLIKQLSKKIKTDEKIKVGVIGYPNTGKSSLINFLIGKSSAGTGSEAGFTKGIQKLKLDSNTVLLDSPGVIPKSEYSASNQEKMTQHTKVGGRSFSQVKNP